MTTRHYFLSIGGAASPGLPPMFQMSSHKTYDVIEKAGLVVGRIKEQASGEAWQH